MCDCANKLQFFIFIKEADVVGNGTREQLIVLHHRTDPLPVIVQAKFSDIDAAKVHFALGGLQQPENDLRVTVSIMFRLNARRY